MWPWGDAPWANGRLGASRVQVSEIWPASPPDAPEPPRPPAPGTTPGRCASPAPPAPPRPPAPPSEMMVSPPTFASPASIVRLRPLWPGRPSVPDPPFPPSCPLAPLLPFMPGAPLASMMQLSPNSARLALMVRSIDATIFEFEFHAKECISRFYLGGLTNCQYCPRRHNQIDHCKTPSSGYGRDRYTGKIKQKLEAAGINVHQ